MKKPKPAKIMAPAHPFTASGAQTTTVWAKPTKKPKPATAGEKIASGDWGLPRRKELSRRIDRAIARAVRKERERCGQIVLAAHLSRGSRWDAYQKIRDDTEREPER